jgi:hypothetical protein
VSYRVHGRVRNGRIHARFGRRGVLSMRFVSSGPFSPTTEPQGDCHGRPAEVREGIFNGAFRWRGEGGFSSASTHDVRGISVRTYREVCKGETAATGRDEVAPPLLRARSASATQAIREVEVFSAPSEVGQLVGRVVETKSGLHVERTVFSLLSDMGVQTDSEGNVIVRAAGAFRGLAEFRADPGEAERWRGDLEADFPGRGFLPLAGSPFEVAFP